MLINLLPNQQKEELLQEEKFKIILILGITFLFFLISLILVFLSIKIYISSQIEAQKIILLEEKKRFEESENQFLQKKLEFLNKEFLKLNSFYQNQINLTEILDKISLLLPLGISLDSFSFSTENYQISLTGFSATRNNLLQFKENLEKEKIFTQVYFPPSSWLKLTDINFSVSFKIVK